MNTKKTVVLIGLFLLLTNAVFADGAKCAGLTSKTFTVGDSSVKIESATLVAANGNLPEHCDVRGVIAPEAKFAVKLPTNWNNRFYMVGGGGYAGNLSLPQMNAGLQQGYATATTDTGHDSQKEPLGTFAERRADNPHADRKKIDYAYLAVHNTALLAKQFINAYYGSAPKYSYWSAVRPEGGRA
jgi:feruloyl esterase